MKKTLSIFLLILVIVSLVGCGVGADTEYNVTFVFGDGRAPVTVKASSDSGLYVPEASDSSLVFAGWFLDAELTRPYLCAKITEDTTLYARFLPRGERVVSYIYNNGTSDTSIIFDGALVAPPDPSREGYVFTGWYDAATDGKKPYEFGNIPTEVHTVLVAGWREQSEGVILRVHPENGSKAATYSYAYAAKPEAPAAPEGGDLDFIGWFANPECTVLYDFDQPLIADTDIYAGWSIDYAALGNMIAKDVLPSTVKINTTRQGFGIQALSMGSGVIYANPTVSRVEYYYILTNAHVVKPYEGYANTLYEVVDAYGNKYNAQCMAMDERYDLAVLRFAAGEKDLPVATFAKEDPRVGSKIVSVGNPDSLANCVTYGEITKYAVADVQNGAVTFEVAWHDSPIYNGSSGGAVFNTKGEIVGINFAAATENATGNFIAGALIQRSRVAEFLTVNNMVFD